MSKLMIATLATVAFLPSVISRSVHRVTRWKLIEHNRPSLADLWNRKATRRSTTA